MTGPWDFWNRYYRWSIQTPLMREMAKMSASIESVTIVLRDHFSPVVRKAARAMRDLGFTLWLVEQPRWQRPFMRFAYRIERLVLR